MDKSTKITVNLDGLDNIRKQVGTKWYAKVGILGSSKASRAQFTNERQGAGGITNAELGVIHEFGSITKGIPARSFLRQPLEDGKDTIMRFFQSKTVGMLIEQGQIKKVFQWLGLVGEGIVQKAFSTSGNGKWEPNSPATIKAKGSSKPLIDTAQLRRSITSEAAKSDK